METYNPTLDFENRLNNSGHFSDLFQNDNIALYDTYLQPMPFTKKLSIFKIDKDFSDQTLFDLN